MSLSSISIKRPVLAIVMSLVIIIFGLISYTYLGVREYPNVDPPVITVSTNYVGANADIIESQITEPLEESINGVAGIKTLTSVSRDGRSTINVEFDLGVDLDAAANDVRDRVSRAISNLPQDVNPPSVAKADADASPILLLNLKSNTKNIMELTEFATNVYKERIQTIPGVSQVNIWGEKKYSMRLWMDPIKMAAFGITPLDIRNAVLNENIELPSGKIEGLATELTVRTKGRLNTVEDYNKLIIKNQNGVLTRFEEVGKAEIYPENDKYILRRDGVTMVGCAVIPQPGSNHIQIAEEFYKRIEELKKDTPADIEVLIGFDTTKFIKRSINEVVETILIAFGLVILIIFVFLRNWRTTLIPMLAIPISLIGTFFIMYLADFTINVLTLLGIVLAIGIVVDDAIVVLENIFRKIEEGMKPIDAAMSGSSEIFFAIISTTLTLVSVFLPIMFLSGLSGRLFREFAIVIAGAVLISAFVALTLTPMLSSRLIKRKENSGKFYKKTEIIFEKLNNAYKNSLDKFMRHRWLSFVIIAITAATIIIIGPSLPNELSPVEDRSAMRLMITAPEGTSFESMDDYMMKLVKVLLDSVPEKDAIISVTSPGFGAAGAINTGFIRLLLTEKENRKRSQTQIANQLSKIVAKMPDARTFVIQELSISSQQRGGAGQPVQYVLKTSEIENLKKILPKFLSEARRDPTFLVVDANLKFNKPEINLEINRIKAKELGVSTADIVATLQIALAGSRISYFILNGKQYQIIGQVPRESRSKPVDLKTIYVKTSNGNLVQLENLLISNVGSSPPQLYRYNRYVSATVLASLAPGKTIGDGIDAMDKISKRVLDESITTSLDGPSKDYKESTSSLLFTFILALILIYLVLAAQFESFRDPFIIMLTVPLALAGALFLLWYFNQTLNIFSQIGQIMLIGLVTKNGILIVEFANQKRKAGMNILDAVKEAAQLRFRPIIMTTLTTILGSLPIALALGAGAESRMSMGIAVIGGLVISGILTLYVIPAIYSYMTKKS